MSNTQVLDSLPHNYQNSQQTYTITIIQNLNSHKYTILAYASIENLATISFTRQKAKTLKPTKNESYKAKLHTPLHKPLIVVPYLGLQTLATKP